MDASLRCAYAVSKRLTAAHGKTYYFSTQFFAPAVRQSVYALYGFVRSADEIVDNPPPDVDPDTALAAYRAATLDALAGPCRSLPALDAFADTVARHAIPAEYPLAFLDAMRMDLGVRRYETFDDLCRYTYGSASVVGLMMTCIVGAASHEARQAAHDLGLAMQLTNFWRDIGEDYRARGRIYLPQEDMRRFDYAEQDLCAGIVDDRFRALMRFEIARARRYYARADAGMSLIPARNRLPVRLARILYSRILDHIEANDFDVFRRRAATTGAEKVAVAFRQAISSAILNRA